MHGDHRRAVHRAADRERPDVGGRSLHVSGEPAARQAAQGCPAALAQASSKAGKLTKYQAQAVYQGKTKGLVFGEYVVLDKLGEGGMGVVLKAQHRRMDRLVAIKVLSPAAMKQAGAVERFHREVEAAAKLSHPNIVTAYDAGEHQGMHYLVMEYVEGKDLASHRQGARAAAGPARRWSASCRPPAGSSMPTSRASSTATSSRAICCWTRRARSRSSTWAWPASPGPRRPWAARSGSPPAAR